MPTAQTGNALPLDLPNARFFPLLERDRIIAEWEQALGLGPDAQLPEAQFLAISGGGDNGAFGSGILVGWTEAGGRPEFEVVTGVSTGALTARFAFLGPEYDSQLRAVYTTITADDIYRERSFIGGIFDDAMSDTTPLSVAGTSRRWIRRAVYADAAITSEAAAARIAATPPPAEVQPAAGPSQGTAEQQLEELKTLYDKGLISKSDYEAKKQEILNRI